MLKSNKLSLSSKGIKYKLKISFYLMSILPLLVCVHLVSNYILPQAGFKLDITAIVLLNIFIAIVGLLVIKEIVNRILYLATEAKLIAAGDISRKVKVESPDEIGSLGESLNQLSDRIRNNMDELRGYSQKIATINIEIHKRVFILSNSLQIISLISKGDKLDNILKLAIEKVRLSLNSRIAYLLMKDEVKHGFYVRITDGVNSEYLLEVNVDRNDKLFDKLNVMREPLVLDKENALSEDVRDSFYEKFKLNNTLAQPVYLRGKLIGILGVGSAEQDFLYKKEDADLLDLFTKQIAIAIENDTLIQRIGALEVRDALTGLYNETFIYSRLEEEIKRAIMYRRPCAFILFNIDNFHKFSGEFGSLQVETTLKKVVSLIQDSFTEVDRVARIGDDEFAIVLPEKNKRQAHGIAENVRKKIESTFIKEHDINKRITVSGGVSENPLDGVTARELIDKAKESLRHSKMQGKNRIV